MAGEKKTFSGKKREEFQGAGKKKETGKQEKPGQDRKKKNRNNAASSKCPYQKKCGGRTN